jgi:hypothetical protein
MGPRAGRRKGPGWRNGHRRTRAGDERQHQARLSIPGELVTVDWVGSDGSSTFSQAQEQAAALKSNWDGAQRQDSEPEASGRRKTGPGTPVRSAPAVPAAQPGWVRARRLPLCGGTGPKRSGQAGLGSRLSHGLARPSHDGMGWPRSSLCKSPMRHVLRGGRSRDRTCLSYRFGSFNVVHSFGRRC